MAELKRSAKMRFSITSVDYAPDELYAQVPIRGSVVRSIPGPDRPDYVIAKLDCPLKWKRDGADVAVSHLVLAARWVGGVLQPAMKHTPVNIAYVVDASVLSDERLDFAKCHYAAIGCADGESDSSLIEKVAG